MAGCVLLTGCVLVCISGGYCFCAAERKHGSCMHMQSMGVSVFLQQNQEAQADIEPGQGLQNSHGCSCNAGCQCISVESCPAEGLNLKQCRLSPAI